MREQNALWHTVVVTRKRRLVWILLVAGAVLVLCALFWPREHEPSYQGRTLSEWLTVYEDNRVGPLVKRHPELSKQAKDAVHHIGTNALPLLVEWLDYEPEKWRYKVADVGARFGGNRLWRIVAGKRMVRSGYALNAFEILGPEAAQVIPALTNLLAGWRGDRTDAALMALMFIGEAGFPPLVSVVTNKTAPLAYRISAAQRIAAPGMNPGTNTAWAAPPLLSCIDEPTMAPLAFSALGDLKIEPALVVPILAQRLEDGNAVVAYAAAEALGKFGAAASNAVPDLVRALASKNVLVREQATNALIEIAPEVLRYPEH